MNTKTSSGRQQNRAVTTSAKGLTKSVVHKKQSLPRTKNNTRLIIGLGNIGKQYADTGHNVGFLIVDQIAQKLNIDKFEFNKKLKSLTAKTAINNIDIILAKPYGYMNESGIATQLLVKYYKINPTNLYVIHDEADLPFNKTKISIDSSSAGHKGIESIIQTLKTKQILRFRVGIGPVINNTTPTITTQRNLKKIVLQTFTKAELDSLNIVAEKTMSALLMLLEDNISKATNIFNAK